MKHYPELFLNKNYPGLKIVFKRVRSSGHDLVPAIIAPMGTKTLVTDSTVHPVEDKDAVWVMSENVDTVACWIEASQIVYYDDTRLQTLFGVK